jgi:hypothetical protein
MDAKGLTGELIKDAAKQIETFKVRLIEILRNDRKLKSDSTSLNSLQVLIKESERYVCLTGVEYMYYVIHGRGPGRFPPPGPDGKWKIPFPVAAKIAKYGNKDKYKPVADLFDLAYNELIENLTKQSGEIALAYVKKFDTIGTVGKPELI